MGRAKEIIVKIIKSTVANTFVKKHHYSGKVVNLSNLHFGCFLDNKLHGVMSYGPPMDKRNVLNLVETLNKGINKKWNEMLELNRMAFDDVLPKNSESRCIAISVKLIRKKAPHIKWIISFADGTQCGDGTIYRASGFKLVGIAENTALRINPLTKETMHVMQAYHLKKSLEFRKWKPIKGYQLKYICFVDKTKEKDLSVPTIPFSKLKELGISMYKGKKLGLDGVKIAHHATSMKEEGQYLPQGSN